MAEDASFSNVLLNMQQHSTLEADKCLEKVLSGDVQTYQKELPKILKHTEKDQHGQITKSEPKFELNAQQKMQDNPKASKGNGGKNQKYIWTQSFQFLEMYIFLRCSVTKKTLKVAVTRQNLTVIAQGETIIQGKWKHQIDIDELFWLIEEGDFEDYKGKWIHLYIQKVKGHTHWWSAPIQSHPQISLQSINHQAIQLPKCEPESRSTCEKGFFDLRQKKYRQNNKDEQDKVQKLKAFMKSHPEMDFSQCKFS